MERKVVAVLILFFLFLNLTPFIQGARNTPPGMVFLGTVHYPIDYFYYLSNIVQGQSHLLSTIYLFTTEPMPLLFVGWIYVILGRIGSIISLSPILMYQVGNTLFGLLYLVFSYLLIRKLFPTSLPKRILTFLLFMISDTFPRVVTENGITFIAPYFSWYNYGEPFVRFSSVPHHLLIQAALYMFLVSFLTLYETSKRILRYVLTGIMVFTAVVLGTTQPIQWAVLTATVFPLVLFHLLIPLPKTLSRAWIKQKGQQVTPYLLFVAIGFLFILYLRKVFSIEPFLSTSIWEAQQSPYLPLDQFVQYHGPVFVMSLFGIPWFLLSKNTARRLLFWISVVSLTIFFFPLTKKLPILTFRFMSSLAIMLYAAMATEAIHAMSKKARQVGPLIQSILLCLLLGLTLPVFWFHLQAKMTFDTGNIYNYLPVDAYRTFQVARELSTDQDTFLVFWPFEAVFPAVAGRRIYFANKFATIDFDRKTTEAAAFIGNQMSPEAMESFLRKNGITFIITYHNAFSVPTPFLTTVHQTDYLMIHKVNPLVIQQNL